MTDSRMEKRWIGFYQTTLAIATNKLKKRTIVQTDVIFHSIAAILVFQSFEKHHAPFTVFPKKIASTENPRPRVVYSSEMTPRQLAELVAEHGAALVLFARQWCDSPEDAVQDAFCKLVGQRKPPDDPAAWLFKIVRNAALDLGKSQRRRAKREQIAARPVRWFCEAQIDGIDAAVAVDALESLAAEQCEVIVARLWGGLTLEKVAATVGCSVSTAHRRFEAGIQLLRERLGAMCQK